jgi:hypothetical protein
MKSAKLLLVTIVLSLTGCEYGDVHGSAERSDVILGLKEPLSEIYSFRAGDRDFTGYFVSDFPVTSASYFAKLPSSFFDHPKLLSYERKKTLIKWQRTPVTHVHKFLLKRAISVMESNGIPKVQIAEFKARSEASDGYYAATFEDMGGGRYDNINFFLLDPKDRRLYELTDTMSF